MVPDGTSISLVAVEMSYQPVRALTHTINTINITAFLSRNEPPAREGIDTYFRNLRNATSTAVEMSYQPVRALTRKPSGESGGITPPCRNELPARKKISQLSKLQYLLLVSQNNTIFWKVMAQAMAFLFLRFSHIVDFPNLLPTFFSTSDELLFPQFLV